MAAELALFDVEVGGILRPTVHCYSLVVLKTIMDVYPDDHLEVYKYLYYMCSHNPKKNPFFDAPEQERESIILDNIDCANWSAEDDEVQAGLALCRLLFTTPTSDAYLGIKTMLENVTYYMRTTQIKDGRDGNLTALVNAAKNFDALRQSFKGTYKDLLTEQTSTTRGGIKKAYDQ